MEDYTNISENYPIEKKDFIRGYVPVKEKYRVTLAQGSKITIPRTKEQKIILETKLIEQINMVTEEDIQNIEQQIKNKKNIIKITSALLIISASVTFIPSLFGELGYVLIVIFGAATLSNVHSLNKEKILYNDIIKNKLILEDCESLNELLQIKNLTVRKDISSLFRRHGKKTVNSFIKHNKKATINNMRFITLEELNYLREAAITYQELIETYDNYEDFSKEDAKALVKK